MPLRPLSSYMVNACVYVFRYIDPQVANLSNAVGGLQDILQGVVHLGQN